MNSIGRINESREQTDLLQAIAVDPGDDTAWLALADTLEEQGDPRCEATRLGVDLRRQLDDPAHSQWEARLRELLRAGVRAVSPQHAIYLGDNVNLEMALISPGLFMMGEGDFQRIVELTQGFYLGIHPVTQAQWQTVMGSNPSHFRGNSLPVECVSWEDCEVFCKKLSERTGKQFVLPTEAQWEYACRAGTTTKYNHGNSVNDVKRAGWYYDNSESMTHPVGEKEANAWGLFDMHGNVWEWCADFFAQVPRQEFIGAVVGTTTAHLVGRRIVSGSSRRIGTGSWAFASSFVLVDPPGPTEGVGKVVRGGSWGNSAMRCAMTNRHLREPDTAVSSVGFRLLLKLNR